MIAKQKIKTLTGSEELMNELSLACKAIASEVSEIRQGGNILNNDKSFDKIMTLIDKASKIKALAADLVADKESEAAVEPEKKVMNIQDYVLNGKD